MYMRVLLHLVGQALGHQPVAQVRPEDLVVVVLCVKLMCVVFVDLMIIIVGLFSLFAFLCHFLSVVLLVVLISS